MARAVVSQDSKEPIAIARMFGGWSGILNCEREGTDVFFSEQGGLNFLPGFLGGGDNGLIHGDLGRSLDTGRPVMEMVWERLPATLILTFTALIIWVTVAILIGVYAAIRRYSAFDQGMTLFSYILYSLPTFWLGLMLIFLFGPALHLLPTGGVVDARDWPAFGTPPVLGGCAPATGRCHHRHRAPSAAARPDVGGGQHRRGQPVRAGFDARGPQR